MQYANKIIQDPVCGMIIDEIEHAIPIEYHGKTYYVCSNDCMKKFYDDPEKYI